MALLILCSVVVVATNACGASVYTGVSRVVAEESGELLAITEALPDDESLYLSVDGGMTWAYTDRRDYSPVVDSDAFVGGKGVITPRGTYRLVGSDVVQTSEGVRNVVYSSADWRIDAHLWLQSRIIDFADTRFQVWPNRMIYHKQSGNIILPAYTRGVIVGTPDGNWTPVPVGLWGLADFSPLAKTQALLSDGSFWLSIWTLPVAFTLLFLVWTAPVRSGIALALAVISAGVSWLPLVSFGAVNPDFDGIDLGHGFLLLIAYSCALLAIGCAASQGQNQLDRWRDWIPALAFMAVVFALWTQSFLPPGWAPDTVEGWILEGLILFVLFAAYSCCVMAVGCAANPNGNQLRRWRDWAPTLTLMILVVLGVFVAWIQIVISLPSAKLLAVGLVILIACERSIRFMRGRKAHGNG